MTRKINSLYFSNIQKATLRAFFAVQTGRTFRSITDITRYLQKTTSDQTYEVIRNLYNDSIDVENRRIRAEKARLERRRKINIEYNNAIVNTQFVNTTISGQVSMKFAISEYSMKTQYVEFIKHAMNLVAKKHKMSITEFPAEYVLNGIQYDNLPNEYKYQKENFEFSINTETAEKLIRRIYDLLMIHAGQYNRIYITNTVSGNVVSSELKSDFDYTDFYAVVKRIIQSAGIAVLGQLTFTIQQRNMPRGGCAVDVPQFLKGKKGISIIVNDDDLCGQRCLVLADCKTNDDLRQMKTDKNKTRFDKKVIELSNELDLKGRMSFLDFEKYADERKKQVIIVSGLFVVMYETTTEYTEQIYIYYDTAINHYHFIHDINSASNDSKRNNKWCLYCKKSIRRSIFDNHKCKETICGLCATNFENIAEKERHFNDAQKNKTWCKCDSCLVFCPNASCLEKHSEKCKGDVKKCQECKKWVKTAHYSEHICGEKFCRNCESYYCGEHRCFITPLNDYTIDDEGNKIYNEWNQTIYAYDFESMFGTGNIHIVNLCITKELFGDKEHVFSNIEEFVKFAVSCKNTTFIAHNGKAYDNWMTHKYIIKHTAHRPTKLILAGNKIMYMKVKSVRFIDSLNHIAQGLATFPATFGLNEMKKGFFPYLFNVAENQNYIGAIPSKEYFNPLNMSIEKYNEFNKWYDTQKNVYDFKKELYEYCESDVDILKRSLEIYITDAINTNGINPLRCSTIASYCLRVFRTNYLEDNKIAVLTKEEYDFCKRGFFGGRTEVFKMFKSWSDTEINEGKYGKYVDIQSLYPSVQFFDDLPCGIPKWDNECICANTELYIDNHYGYIECDIECPQNLHIPLLPEKKNNKLMFDLVDKTKKVYSSIELKRAIEVGYKITKIYKSLTFEKTNNLFTGYIQKFLKIKTQSAGYDGDDIDDYIERYKAGCGVLLEKTKIKSNNGMKLLAKICLNSLWGKFGQNDELPTTAYIKNDAWFKLLQRHIDKKVELKNEILIDDDTLYVSYIEKEEARTSLMTTNLGLAGFVTSNARLRLYKELYKLDERVVYCDTDSIIYEYDKSKYNVIEGDCLGEWELEEDKDDNKVKHAGNLRNVYALAPKTYGYTTITGLQKYKCKGITLNYGNKTHFTFDKLKKLITGDADGNHKKIITYSDDFIKDTKTGNIYTKTNVPKDTNYCEDEFKRQFFEDGTSTPFKNRSNLREGETI